jgi:hypothetical protein
MLSIVKVFSSDTSTIGQRIIKALRFGKNDTQTAVQVSVPGVDSNPIKDMIAVYGKTAEQGDTVIVGYLLKGMQAEPGEIRLFSTDAEGTEKFYTWLKADGTMELGGTADFLTRFNALKSGFDALKDDHNDLVSRFNAFLIHVHGGSGTPPTPPATPDQPSTASIDDAKISQIKTL